MYDQILISGFTGFFIVAALSAVIGIPLLVISEMRQDDENRSKAA